MGLHFIRLAFGLAVYTTSSGIAVADTKRGNMHEETTVIEGQAVTEADIGRAVSYLPPHGGEAEHGYLSSYRKGNVIYMRFGEGETGHRCPTNRVRWGHVRY